MPSLLARVLARYATMHVAIIVYASIGFIISVSGGFKELAVIASASLLIIYLGVALALIRLRKKSNTAPHDNFLCRVVA